MKLLLTGPRQLEVRRHIPQEGVPEGEARLRVLYCAVCRTDAKMWGQGHRDLVLPRVPGHEMVVADDKGCRFAVWPGNSCGRCGHCRAGRESRCERIRIIGFHRDGGFADQVLVPRTSLLLLPETMDPLTACFAEPVGCVLHALGASGVDQSERVLIFGGGTMGLLTALAVKAGGGSPVILENDPGKISRARPFLDEAGLVCLPDINRGGFEAVFTACADPAAFGRGLEKLAKGGRFCFFSGLAKDQVLTSDLLNLVHYKEITLSGAYGLNKLDMEDALGFLGTQPAVVSGLVEKIVSPEQVPDLMAGILSGKKFKYIIDFKE